jgi:hypothetical protein
VVFPPVYGRAAPLCTPGAAVIVTARVQQAEVGEGGGSPVVLIAERVLPYKVEAQGPQLDVTPVPQRAARAERAPRQAKDPTEYSKSGVRYYRAPRNGDLAPPDDLPEPPPDLPEPPIEAYDEPPPANAEYGLRVAESPPPAAFRPDGPTPRQDNGPVSASSARHDAAGVPQSTIDEDSAIHNRQLAQSAIRNPQSALVITLPPPADDAADEARMRELRAILRRFPGATPVTLAFPDDLPGGAPTLLPLRHGVDAGPALRAAITALLGAECLAPE